MKYYRPIFRSPSTVSLPPGIVWELAEIPRLDAFRYSRPDLRVSRFTYGIIKCEVLSKEE